MLSANRFECDACQWSDAYPNCRREQCDACSGDDPDTARGAADEIALLLGQGEVFEKKGRWQVSLSLEESFIAYQDGTKMHPFKIVSKRFSSSDTDLKSLMNR
jgi:hypothetical protein